MHYLGQVLRVRSSLPLHQYSRASLEEVFRRHRTEADAVDEELADCKATSERCTCDQQPLTSIFQFYQDIRGYVTDLRDCLNEKVGSHTQPCSLNSYQYLELGGNGWEEDKFGSWQREVTCVRNAMLIELLQKENIGKCVEMKIQVEILLHS